LTEFVVGINLPWLKGRYGTDLSYNQFSGRQLWEYPYEKPIDYDFTRPDPNPPKPLVKEDPQILSSTFDKFEGIDVVRIWLFERLEGLVFDQNNNLLGIHPSMIESINQLLEIAQAKHFQVYFCLLNGWDAKWELPEQLKNIEHRVKKYNEWAGTIAEILKRLVKEPEDYCDRILAPFVNLIQNNPSVYAVDLMNEPEGLTKGISFGIDAPIGEDIVRKFLDKCAHYFKNAGIRCTTGWMRWENAMRNSDLTCDFIDFHRYSTIGIVLPFFPALFHNKTCVIGECGYPVKKNDEFNRRLHGVRLATSIISNAKSAGFSGALAWPIEGSQMTTENENLLAWLKQYAIKKKMQKESGLVDTSSN